ncbi:MAG: ImcF-related family protein [Terracidiphilus sp.]
MLPILMSILILVVSIVLAWLVGPLLGLAGTALLVLRILLVLLGAAAAGIILFFYFRDKRRDAATKNITGGNDMDSLLRDAEKHLAAAQRGGARTLDTLPLLYILGDANSAKTTSVLKSGFDPELLAGQVYRDQDVVATPVVNIWFAHESVFIEAGDAIRRAPALWSKLIRKTRPKAMRSAVGKQAPVRAAVVCVSIEQFLGATAADAVIAAARTTNQMLRELAQQLGTEIPVYVILTKLDRMPHFTEYVRNLTTDEASQPFGMPFSRNAVSSGLYAEKATTDVTAALDRILFALGEYRLELLNRENDQNNVDPVYEFPREMRKLRNNLASYLVELARPSHLNANPYLRGFYCTGVRAHMVEQMVAAAAQQPQSQPVGAGATRMFTVESMKAVTAPAQPQTVTRKQAQWCFLPRIFPNVILEDRSALAVTSNSQRTHLFRRIVLGSVSALLLLFLIFLTVSWSNNSRLERSVIAAANAIPTTSVPNGVLAPTQYLQPLDQLRASLVQLEDYQKNGAPLMYRWGLYHGNSVLEGARRIYFDRFRRLLLTNTQANLISYLNGLPTTPAAGADYTATYNPLKAYLITTSNPDKSTVEFLSPVLMQYWENGKIPETEEQKDLASRQFEYYSGELAQSSPYNINPDTLAVTKARAYLSNFGGFERIYQSMITAAGKVAPAIDFNKNYPGSNVTVVDSHVVAGAFTRGGFTFMQDAIKHPERYYNGEVWVLGNQAQSSLDLASVTQQLATRYVTDYETEWRTFLHSAAVVHYRGLADAGGKLQILSNPSSPLLELFFTASHNTAVANPDISKEFQPTQAIVAPDTPDRLIAQGNQGYMNGLLGLQTAVAQVAQSPNPNDPTAAQPVIAASASAHQAASQAAQAFNLDPQGHVDQTVLALMQAPITSVDEVLRGAAPAAANSGGAGLCGQFGPVMAKFPFSPNSQVDASPAEVGALLQPGSGALWQFYDAKLKTVLQQQGSIYVPTPGAPVKATPAFLHFFNKAAALSSLLYPAGGAPGLNFNVHILKSPGIQMVAFVVDSQRLAGSDVSRQFTWSFATAQQVQIVATYGTNSLPLPFSGSWGLFHFVNQGKVEQSGANVERLAYPLEIANTPIKAADGTPLVMHIELSGSNVGLLAPGALSDMKCVSTVAH